MLGNLLNKSLVTFSAGRNWIFSWDDQSNLRNSEPSCFLFSSIATVSKSSWDEISEKESLAMTEHPSEELEKLAEFNAKVLLFLLGKVEKIEIS